MKFSHPLARGARLGRVETVDDGAEDVLVVVTTLQTDPTHKKYKADKVQRLRDAAREFLKERAPGVSRILLWNPD